MKLFEIKGTRKSIEARIKELEQYLSVKDRVLRGGNALSPGERQNVIASKKEIEQLKKQLKKLQEATDSDGKEVDKDVPPAEDTELADQKPTEKDDAEENEDEGTEDADQPQDVGSVASREGFTKTKKEMYAFGATRPVTLLTKNQKIGGMDITLQYVINPKTGAWSLRACLAGQSDEDMVEFTTGEDPSSLAKNLQKKTKITPHQLVDNLNPPADKVAKPKENPETDDAEDQDDEADDEK